MIQTLPFKYLPLIFLFLLLGPSVFGQVQVLKEYDFNEGGYYLLGQFSESDRNTLRDSLGEFYTDDIALLNQFKKDWIFSQPGKRYACGYHYRIYICKGGQALESFGINLNCKEIVGEKGYYYFNPDLLRKYYGKLKKPYSQNSTFQTLQEARAYWQKIKKDTRLIIMSPEPKWTRYEGSFRFTYKSKEHTKDCLDNPDQIFKSVESEIKREYPDESFSLYNVGGSLTTMELEITCNQSLSDQFALYYRDKDSFGKWKPFDLRLKTYWIANPQK